MASDPTVHWEWLGHFSVRVTFEDRTIYIDPFGVRRRRLPADLVLITNPRLGHFSPEDIERVCHPDTIVAGPADAVAGLPGNTRSLCAGDEWKLGGLTVRAVPAYSVRTDFFPRDRGWLGYVVNAGGFALYHAGATDRIPEMDGIQADVAFLPASGRYVMDEAAARVAAEIVGAEARVALFVVGDRYERLSGFVTESGRDCPRS